MGHDSTDSILKSQFPPNAIMCTCVQCPAVANLRSLKTKPRQQFSYIVEGNINVLIYIENPLPKYTSCGALSCIPYLTDYQPYGSSNDFCWLPHTELFIDTSANHTTCSSKQTHAWLNVRRSFLRGTQASTSHRLELLLNPSSG